MGINIDMKGKTALVTGAASGLGAATALRLARGGANVCLVDINPEGLVGMKNQIQSLNVKVASQCVDIMVADNCRLVVEEAVKVFGRLDALCNVAGVLTLAHADQMSVADWDRTLGVNLSAPFYLMQAAIPHLLETHGAVVNVTSIAASLPMPYHGAYAASKAGLTHLTKVLAMEYIHKPIRFNAVAPGGMMTSLVMKLTEPPECDPSLLKRFSPMRGVVETDDVAELVAFLASDAARGYHGAVFNLDNGMVG